MKEEKPASKTDWSDFKAQNPDASEKTLGKWQFCSKLRPGNWAEHSARWGRALNRNRQVTLIDLREKNRRNARWGMKLPFPTLSREVLATMPGTVCWRGAEEESTGTIRSSELVSNLNRTTDRLVRSFSLFYLVLPLNTNNKGYCNSFLFFHTLVESCKVAQEELPSMFSLSLFTCYVTIFIEFIE